MNGKLMTNYHHMLLSPVLDFTIIDESISPENFCLQSHDKQQAKHLNMKKGVYI